MKYSYTEAHNILTLTYSISQRTTDHLSFYSLLLEFCSRLPICERCLVKPTIIQPLISSFRWIIREMIMVSLYSFRSGCGLTLETNFQWEWRWTFDLHWCRGISRGCHGGRKEFIDSRVSFPLFSDLHYSQCNKYK